ncbi:homeodomain-like protein [Tanacetum coccineum]
MVYPLPLDTVYQSSITESDPKRHFKTLSLEELRSPDFNLFFDKEYSEEEVAETMAETMEQYMSKTRADYGSWVARPKIKDKDNFELKGQFLKELRINTFNGSDHKDTNEHIEKVLEIIDLFHIQNITIYQVMLRAFLMSLTGAISHWLRNEPTGSITTWDGLKTKFLNKYCPPARTAKKMEEILDSRGAIPSKTIADPKVAIQEMVEYSQKWHNGTSRSKSTETFDGLAAIQAQLNNLGRQIKKVNEKVYAVQEREFGSLPSSTEANPRDQVKSISTTIEADSYPIRHIGSYQYAVGEEKIVFTSFKPAISLIKRVYMLSLRERIELDLEARLMGETLVLNRLIDPFFKDYIELNDLNEPYELRRNQGDDLMPTIKEGEMVYKENNVVRALMNVPIFVGTFSIVTDFIVLEDMDAYRDEGMDDVIFGEPFLRDVGIKTRRFEGMITIYNGSDEVTYQMMRSHLRFKHHTNEQCNKIPPLLKVSEEDKMNGISHPFQKLKGFYNGVLNLRADYIRDAKMEEWLTHGHISVHEMEWKEKLKKSLT